MVAIQAATLPFILITLAVNTALSIAVKENNLYLSFLTLN